MFMRPLIITVLSLNFASLARATQGPCESALKGIRGAKPTLTATSTSTSHSRTPLPKTLKAESLPLAQAIKSTYRIEVVGKNSSQAMEIRLSDQLEKLSRNVEVLDHTQTSILNSDLVQLHYARILLAVETAKLISLGAKRYEGSETEMVLARDAFARQIETAVKMTGNESTARLPEVNEHLEFVRAIVAEKRSNPALTDAEATAKGVQLAYKNTFVQKCQDGSCQVPSADVLWAGAKARLKELKDCI